MEYLGEHNSIKAYWWKYSEETFDELPNKNWVAFGIEDGLPDYDLFKSFARSSIIKGILEFKAFGRLSSKSLANAFWDCFFVAGVPEIRENNNGKIICFHFDNIDKRAELKEHLNKFNQGWLPSDEEEI